MNAMLLKGVRIFIASETVDGRKSFDGLAGIVKQVLKREPLSGDLYVFRNRTSKRAKALLWDRTGWVLIYKRLESGCFRFPYNEDGSVEVDANQLRMLLDGIELGYRPRRKVAQ